LIHLTLLNKDRQTAKLITLKKLGGSSKKKYCRFYQSGMSFSQNRATKPVLAAKVANFLNFEFMKIVEKNLEGHFFTKNSKQLQNNTIEPTLAGT
jgi:hypothetical protein